MKIKNLILGLTALLVVTSCSEDNYIIKLKEAGRISLDVTNVESPLEGEKVYLIPLEGEMRSSEVIEYSIDNQVTDANGHVSFGDVNVGNYYIVMEDVEIDGKFYNPFKLVQAVSDVHKSYSLNVMDYTGTIEVTVKNYDNTSYEYEPYSGAKVAVLTENDYYNFSTIEERLTKKIEEQTTGSNGKVTFTLPSGESYYAIVYLTNESYTSEYLSYVDAGEEEYETIETNF